MATSSPALSASGPAKRPSPQNDYELVASKLSDPHLDLKVKYSIASELKDSIDFGQRDYDLAKLVEILLPVFFNLLQQVSITLEPHSNEHRLRNTVLTILSRFPYNDIVRPHYLELAKLFLNLLKVENEENAVLCVKTLGDIHRNFCKEEMARHPPKSEGHSNSQGPLAQDVIPQELFNPMQQNAAEIYTVLTQIYASMPNLVNTLFGQQPTSLPSTGTPPDTPGMDAHPALSTIFPGMRSFKVLQESPPTTVFIMQHYPRLADDCELNLLPKSVEFLQLEAPPQREAHEAARLKSEHFIGVADPMGKDNVMRERYGDFVFAQVKTLSFLAYVVRSRPSLKNLANVPNITVRLLKDVLPEATVTRKELFIATRHILSTEYRLAFLPEIDNLLDEKILIGPGTTAFETLRPIAFSMLADLIHHVRSKLTLDQLRKVCHLYTITLHDPTLQPTIQTMCCKLLMNIMDSIQGHLVLPKQDSALPPPESDLELLKEKQIEVAQMLERISESFVEKLVGMSLVKAQMSTWGKGRPKDGNEGGLNQDVTVPDFVHSTDDITMKDDVGEMRRFPSDEMDVDKESAHDEDVRMEEAQSLKAKEDFSAEKLTATGRELDDIDIERAKPIGGMSVMVDTVTDLQKLMYDYRFLFKNVVLGYKAVAMTQKSLNLPTPDGRLVGRFFEAIVRFLPILDPREDQGRKMRELIEASSVILFTCEKLVMQEVLETQMDFMVSHMIVHPELVSIPQHLLSNLQVSPILLGIIYRHLLKNLESLASKPKEEVDLLIKFYKMSFMSVTVFPEMNEAVLQPYLNDIIMTSLKCASRSRDSTPYYMLLRSLFRSIGGGKFENLYREVLPMLQTLLDTLNNLLLTSEKPKSDLFAELALTVPVRLNVLLPYLSYLMKPLVHSLKGSPDLITQGLRTLDLCVDNLTQEFLGPLIAPVIHDIMSSLWKLLKPNPSLHPNHSHTTFRILGKIGGRNRKLLGPTTLDWKEVDEEALLAVRFDGAERFLTITPLIDLAIRIISKSDSYFRDNALQLLKRFSILFLNKDDSYNTRPLNVFRKVAKGLFDASLIPETESEASQFIINLSMHIFEVELECRDTPKWASSPGTLMYGYHPLSMTIMEAIIEGLAGAEGENLTRGCVHLQHLIESVLKKCSRSNPNSTKRLTADWGSAILHQFAQGLSSLCYNQSWARKTAGAAGISVLVTKLSLGQDWYIDHELVFVRALVFALKDMPTDPPGNIDEVSDVLLKIIAMCNVPRNSKDVEDTKKQNFLASLLIVELSSQIASVRTTTQKAFEILAKGTGGTVTDLLFPVKDRLLHPIYKKPLRALAFPMQIGHIDAITYAINLRPPLIEPSDELHRVVTEALGIADADDTALIGKERPYQKTASSLTQLRIVCVKLLTAVMSIPDFFAAKQVATRMRILSAYFKLLYSRSSAVVDAAYSSLRELLLQSGKLPKDLLQSALRPVLTNLSDHKRLDVNSLHGLARLLELLTNYFKVEIGQKLLDHYRQLADVNTVLESAMNPSNENSGVNVMAGIINVFHLLPHPGAGCFMLDLLHLTIEVEKVLKKTTPSALTEPLGKYLNRYPAEATNFFVERMDKERHAITFRNVLKCDCCQELRKHVIDQIPNLFPRLVNGTDDVVQHAYWMIEALVGANDQFFVDSPDTIQCIVNRWVSPFRQERLASSGISQSQQLKEDVLAIDLFMRYFRSGNAVDPPLIHSDPHHIDVLFHLAQILTFHLPYDFAYLVRFFNEEVARSSDVPMKRRIIERFLDRIFWNDHVPDTHKCAILRYVINPIILVSCSRGQGIENLIDVTLIHVFHHKVWKPFLADRADADLPDEGLRIELLHTTTLLIEHYHRYMGEIRKDTIKFGWVNLKVHDVTVKQVSHVLITRFLNAFESPHKIVMQILQALLVPYQAENRALVQKAQDNLFPALPRRLSNVEGNSLHPLWVKVIRRKLVEEISNIPQALNILDVIKRFHDMLFPYRDLLVTHVALAISKLFLMPSTTNFENRSLALDLVEVMLQWEKKRVEMSEDKEMTLESRRQKNVQYCVPTSVKEQIINTLIRFAASAPDQLSRKQMVPRALHLLKELMGETLWCDIGVKLNIFQKIYHTYPAPNHQTLPILSACADVLNVIISCKSDSWVLSTLGTHQKMVEKILQTPDYNLHAAQKVVVDRLFAVLPKNSELQKQEPQGFLAWAQGTIMEGLKNPENLPATMVLLQAWCSYFPNDVEAFLPPLATNSLLRLVRDHIRPQQLPHSQIYLHQQVLTSAIDLLSAHMSTLGDNRKHIFSVIVQLTERSPSSELCKYLLQLVRRWIFDSSSCPTMKEKATVLARMSALEKREDKSLIQEYLMLVLDIYKSPQFYRTELTVRLEPSFLIGCRFPDHSIRNSFLEVFDLSISRSLFPRLQYIIGVQNWEPLADTNWIRQATDLLLGSIDTDSPLVQSSIGSDSDFLTEIATFSMGELLGSARRLLHADDSTSHELWISTFKIAWSCLPESEQADITRLLTVLLAKEYHVKSVEWKPSMSKTLLSAALACEPLPNLPPQLVRYLGKTFSAFHTAVDFLENQTEDYHKDDSFRLTSLDALTDLYAELNEVDYALGSLQRRSR